MQISEELLSLCKQAARISEDFDDALIKVYISAGLAQYSAYTGRSLESRRERYVLDVNEHGQVELPSAPTPGTDITFSTPQGRKKIPVNVYGERYVTVPMHLNGFLICNSARVEVEYTSGPRTCELPSNVITGLMRYVTYCYEHRGDDIVLINGRGNGPAASSGALDEWRPQIPLMYG